MKRMKMFSTGRASKKGVALIITLAVLVLLALLGITFATLTGIERGIAQNRVDEVRARISAKAGIEDAMSRLNDMVSSGFFSGTNVGRVYEYCGNDTTEQDSSASRSTPIEEAKNPSFAYENEEPQNPTDVNVTPRLIKIEGKDRGFSGYMGTSTYGKYSDIYTLKVKDTSGSIFINDGLAQGPNSPTTQNLKRMLNVLGSLPTVNVIGLGDLIVNNRPYSGWRSKYELLNVSGIDVDKFNKFKDFITTNAWVDNKVVNPVPLSADMLTSYPMGQYYYRGDPPVYRYGSSGTGRGVNYVGQVFNQSLVFWPEAGNMYSGSVANAVWGLDELNPIWIETTSRAPVNINTVSKEVLISLLANLQGFFMVERRRNYPHTNNSVDPATVDGLAWLGDKMTYDSTDNGFSAIGYLYTTIPIIVTSSGNLPADYISAENIADEIMYCRTKVKSPITGIDYSQVAYSGQFKNWVQFDTFCDGLVGNLLKDERNIFSDYDPTDVEVVSKPQQEYAGQAIADVLKANFNPNLHLNELNPDANMFLRVDKTDLLCNSTEFCFTPTGYFEIESLGQVLKPVGNGQDSWTASDNSVRAQKKIIATVKLYDVYRETTQKDFYKGTISRRTYLSTRPISPINTETNNNKPLEIGPEVQQGNLPNEVEYGGMITLSTIGADYSASDITSEKPKDQFIYTTMGGKYRYASIHSHFSNDVDAHYNETKELNDNFRKNISNNTPLEGSNWNYPLPVGYPVMDSYYTGPAVSPESPYAFKTGTPGKYPKIESTTNYPDKGETSIPPYAPNTNRGGGGVGEYRLAHSFRVPDYNNAGTVTMPTLKVVPPSNLRVDGAFVERNSGLAYWIDEGYNFDSMHGAMSFWVKPAFFPEMAGKPRILVSASRWIWRSGYRNYWGPWSAVKPTPFSLFFMPAQDHLADNDSPAEGVLASEPIYDKYKHAGRFRPASLLFWYTFSNSGGYNNDFGDLDTGIPYHKMNTLAGSSCYDENCPTLSVGVSHLPQGGCHPHCADDAEQSYLYKATEPFGFDNGIMGGVNTPSLNHKYHKHNPAPKMEMVEDPPDSGNWVLKEVYVPKAYDAWLRGHRWSYVTFKWTANQPNWGNRVNSNSYVVADPLNTWEIYMNGQVLTDTKGFPNKELAGPVRRPHFSVHSLEWRNGVLGRHLGNGSYQNTTVMVKVYKQVPVTVTDMVLVQDPNGPVVKDEQERYIDHYERRSETYYVRVPYEYEYTYSVRVPDGTEIVRRSRQVPDGTEEYEVQVPYDETVTGTRQVYKQIGSHTETTTTQVPDGWMWQWDPAGQQLIQVPKFKTVTTTITVPDYGWVEETYTYTVRRYRTETRTRTKYRTEYYDEEVTKYRQESRTETRTGYRNEPRTREWDEPIYAYRTIQVRYREEPRTRTENQYRWVDEAQTRQVWDAVANSGIKIATNTIRIGEASSHNLDPYPRNWSADSTVDEFYLWKGLEVKYTGADMSRTCPSCYRSPGDLMYGYGIERDASTAVKGDAILESEKMWKLGRYYSPKIIGGIPEANFTSGAIDLTTSISSPTNRNMPAPSTIAPPPGEIMGSYTPSTSSVSKYRILGASWTWFAEGVNPVTLQPVLYDGRYVGTGTDAAIYPSIDVSFLVDGVETTTYNNSSYSSILDASGLPISISDPKNIKYKVYFKMNANQAAILLATPVFDDITLFIDSGPQIISYIIL